MKLAILILFAAMAAWGQVPAPGSGISGVVDGAITVTGSSPQIPYISAANALTGSGYLTSDETNRRAVSTRGGQEFDGIADPSNAPTVALLAVAGNVDAGAHQYYVTFTSGSCGVEIGETLVGPASSIVTTDAGHGQVTVTRNNTAPTGAVNWCTYRTFKDCPVSSCVAPALVTTTPVATLSITDNTPDSALTIPEPQSNSTTGLIYNGSNLVGEWAPNGLLLGPSADRLQVSSNFKGIYVSDTSYGYKGLPRVMLYFTPYTSFNFCFGTDSCGAGVDPTGTFNLGLSSFDALFDLTTGINNTVVSPHGNDKITSGTDNTFVGDQTGLATTTQRNFCTTLGSHATCDANDAVSVGHGITNAVPNTVNVGTNSVILAKLLPGGWMAGANTAPAVSGCTSAAIVAGSTGVAGQVNTTPTGACALTLTFAATAAHGWNCAISNMTTANLIRQTATTTTTAVFTGVTVANDVLAYGPCVGW